MKRFVTVWQQQHPLPNWMEAKIPMALAVVVMAPAAIAMGFIVVLSQSIPRFSLCLVPRKIMSDSILDATALTAATLDVTSVFFSSLIMIVAMNLPLVLNAAGHVYSRSFVEDRLRHITIFCLNYTALTTMVAFLIAWLSLIMRAGLWIALPGNLIAALFALTAAAIRITSFADRALKRCHAMMPLRAFAPGSLFDAAHFGVISGLRCVKFCWPTMILPWFSRTPLLCMAVATIAGLYDRMNFRPSPRVTVGGYLIIGIVEILS